MVPLAAHLDQRISKAVTPRRTYGRTPRPPEHNEHADEHDPKADDVVR